MPNVVIWKRDGSRVTHLIKGGKEENDIEISGYQFEDTQDAKSIASAATTTAPVVSSMATTAKLGSGKIIQGKKIEMKIFADDTVFDVKMKIAYYLGIPIYRQHLWINALGCFYRFYRDNVLQLINIKNLATQEIKGYPVDMDLYRDKEWIKIESYDKFTSMRGIVADINVLDLAEFSTTDTLTSYEIDIIYHTFILQYYPMLSHAAFIEYLSGNIASFPQLTPKLTHIPKLIDLQERAYKNPRSKLLTTMITVATIQMINKNKKPALNLRVLFEKLKLTDNITMLKLHDFYGGKFVILHKIFENTKNRLQETVNPYTLAIHIKNMTLHIQNTGSYEIHCNFPVENHVMFKDAIKEAKKIINPVIHDINTKMNITYPGLKVIIPFVDDSAKFIDISLSVVFTKAINDKEFSKLLNVAENFVELGIIKERAKSKLVRTFDFIKGMFDFDPKRLDKAMTVSNHYSHMYDIDVASKWALLFETVRKMTITHRFSDIKIDISGLKEREFDSFIVYINQMLAESGQTIVSHVATSAKLLNNLNDQDPVLYKNPKMKEKFGVYSKICQKPHQPMLMTESQYKDLKNKDGIVKYWNFTTQSDAYYKCPNKKYPYVKFITGKHPDGYCMVCCGITPTPERTSDQRSLTYYSCLDNHTAEKKKADQSSSRYIMTYGKPVDVGRLCTIPEKTLGQLAGQANESFIESRYYILGVPQYGDSSGEINIGCLFAITDALGTNPQDFIIEAIKRITKSTQIFSTLLHGSILLYFQTSSRLCEFLKKLILQKILFDIHSLPMSNNILSELFIDITKSYFDVGVLVFDDINTAVSFRTPPYAETVADISVYTKYIILITINTYKVWYPIYYLIKDIYFRTGNVDRKVYNSNDQIILAIQDMCNKYFENKKDTTKITLAIILDFCKSQKLKVKYILCTNRSIAYGLVVDKFGYIPINASYINRMNTIPILYNFDSQNLPTATQVITLIKQYNKWVAVQSEAVGSLQPNVNIMDTIFKRVIPIYPYMTINSNLVLYVINKEKDVFQKTLPIPIATIALIVNDLNWYIKREKIKIKIKQVDWWNTPSHAKQAPASSSVRITLIDPIECNTILAKWPYIDNPNIFTNYDKIIYKSKIYDMLMLKIIQIMNSNKNTKIRAGLKNATTKNLASLITGFSQWDQNKLVSQMSEATLSGTFSFREIVDNDVYDFDKILYSELQKLEIPKIVEKLKILLRRNITTKQPKQTDLLVSSLADTDKIYVPANAVNNYLQVLANDIKNPLKMYLFMTPLAVSMVINYFKINKFPNEHIIIEI